MPCVRPFRFPSPALGLTLLFLVLLGLGGCAPQIDPAQMRLCRQAIPAVAAPDATVTVLRVLPARPPWAVRLDYREEAAGAVRRRAVQCGFDGEDRRAPHLTRFATEEKLFSPLQVHILNRFWLDRQQLAGPADPGPGLSERPALSVSGSTAYLMQVVANALPATSINMLLAVAYALIYGLIGRINLAFGEFAVLGSLGAVAASAVAASLGLQGPASLALLPVGALGLALLYGHWTERLVVAPLAFARGQAMLIATVALALVMQEAINLVDGPALRWIEPVATRTYSVAAAGRFVVTVSQLQLAVTFLALALALGVFVLMRRSEFGRRWRATADDPVMANLMGVAPRRLLRQSFALATLLAAVAGLIVTVYYGGAGFSGGMLIGIKGLVAAVVGGIGSVGGALLGGLVVGLFEALWTAWLPGDDRDIAVLALVVVALVFRPGGLAGFADGRPRRI